MRRRSAALAAALLVLPGCAGFGGDDDDATVAIARGDLAGLVLQPADLTGPWVQFDEGRQARADAPPGTRADSRRFGRIDGWKARYRRGGTPTTPGPLVVESRVDLFAEESGAREDLRALEEQLAADGWSEVDAPALGEERVAATLRQAGEPAVRFYLVAWRQDALTASVLVSGFEGRTTLSAALALARSQQRRIAAAGRG